MRIKKLHLSKQYFATSFIFLFLLIIVIVSRQESISQEYRSIITKMGYIGMLICGLSGFLKQERVDESAEKVLSKVNHINMVFTSISLMVLAVIIGAPALEKINMTRDFISLLIISLLFMINLIRAILFVYYDRKGLKNAYLKDYYTILQRKIRYETKRFS